jgi:hypothetical protein
MTTVDKKIRIVKISDKVPTVTNFYKLENYYFPSLEEKGNFIRDNFNGCVIHYISCGDNEHIVSILVNFYSNLTKQKYSFNGAFVTIGNTKQFVGHDLSTNQKVSLSDFNFLIYMLNENFED